ASVHTNAHFARIVLKTNYRMSARTVVAASRRDRSGQRQNGAQGFHLQSVHPQLLESTCRMVLKISQLTRCALSTYRQKTADASPLGPLMALSGHDVLHCICPLKTQSKHADVGPLNQQ